MRRAMVDCRGVLNGVGLVEEPMSRVTLMPNWVTGSASL